MHVTLDAEGRVRRHGPLVARLSGAAPAEGGTSGTELAGALLFDLFRFRRPRGLASMDELRTACGATLRLTLRSDGRTSLAGVAVPLPGGGVLLDLSFGLGVVEAVRRHRLNATDFAPTDMAVEMLYLVEANDAVMSESRRLVERLQGARMAAEAEASSDALTGLRNRRALDAVLAGLLHQERPFALMGIDLDLFKQVNDTLGHAAGDQVLRRAARVMLGAVRAGDVVARTGGDEFVILFPNLVRSERLAEIADRLIEGLEQPIQIGDEFCAISASIGVTTTAAYTRPDAERMTADADAALYASKNDGRGRATVWTSPRDAEEAVSPGARVTLRPIDESPAEEA
jgi:diguanylate cyclase (GGDEF)-like protein